MANIIGKSDDLYEVWKGYNKLSEFSRPLANGVSAAHDGFWLFNKLRHGYTVIDIGVKTTSLGRGLWYGTERGVLAVWQTRNIWKMPLHCLP